MPQHQEKAFEDEFCEHLASHGWLYSASDEGYDAKRALYPADVVAWFQETQPKDWSKAVPAEPGTPAYGTQVAGLLDRVVKVLDTPLESGGGTLNVLRNPLKAVSASFKMCQFRPANALNADLVALHWSVRLRVMRQVHFSAVPGDTRSVDLVFFVNGLPVATAELKTDFTQSVGDAVRQYKTRLPKDKGGHVQPLFGFGTRALVHFAVSNDEVYMTTKLAGPSTYFLPFNRGLDDGKGNPPIPGTSATAYLWTDVMERSAFLDILGKFCHLETRTDHDPITGKKSTRQTLLFPRFHQWDAVTSIVDHVRAHGPGQRYLIQHSAGSGKTNTIAWTAHQLARLHDADNAKVFDKVIVVTDRTVLDSQLQAAVRQIDPSFKGDKDADSPVVTIDDKQVRESGSKSKALVDALASPKHIVVVTMQTFPWVMDVIADGTSFAAKNFAVIADEAHSSQSGNTAATLRQLLSKAGIEHETDPDAETDEFETQDVFASLASAKANTPNVSFLAFTATPKGKTLELFGTPTPDDGRVPFSLYTMKQAIEEGFILDVLRGYQTYEVAYKVAQDAEELGLVDKSEATKAVLTWVKLHPTNIGQKVAIIVEHFRTRVAHLLDGHAKAMVVTGSRIEAVRFKAAMDAYIKRRGYDLHTLVAFSGTVNDDDTPGGPFTETSMNPSAIGNDLAEAFSGPTYRVMIVANKFQTGFDQPLLSAMYVNKRLAGVTAVQTLSRLNRTYRTPSGELKELTFVIDFVNKPEEIQAAFEPYYLDAVLDVPTDPNLVHDLSAKLDQAGIFTSAQVDQAANAWMNRGGNNALAAAVKPARDEFFRRRTAAIAGDNKTEIERSDVFRKDVSTYVRVYDFMSQIIDYADGDLEKRAIFLRLLARFITGESETESIDLAGLELTVMTHKQRDSVDISLNGDTPGLKGFTAAGSGLSRDPVMVAMQDVIDALNDLFGDDFSGGQSRSVVEMLLRVLLENEALREQAASNTRDQFIDSPDLQSSVLEAVLANEIVHAKFAEHMQSEGVTQHRIIAAVGEMLYLAVGAGAASSA